MEAITREQIFLAKIIGETVPDIEPIVRKEMFLARIAGMDIPAIEPITREEMFLNAIANKEVIGLNPITRREMFLAKAMGADIEVPNPITRSEFYLSQMTGGEPEEPEEPENPPVDPADKYTWEGVFESIDKGTYATDYAIGDTVPLDLGSEGLINMQIAAFDTDDLADGSGKAPITWISKELLATKRRMHDGTSITGGWPETELRSYLKNTIKPMIPELVRNAIVEVTKNIVTLTGEVSETEDVWIPNGYGELITGRDVAKYLTLFPDDASRQKCIVGSTTSGYWWSRSLYSKTNFYNIKQTGSIGNGRITELMGVCLCFCT